MRVQQRISEEIEAEKVNSIQRVIIDRQEGYYYIGRTQYCSPEVDPEVLIPVSDRWLEIGEFYDVLITDSEEFDIYGITIK
jgi:ribosomal protein S12 methylthiotransferase